MANEEMPTRNQEIGLVEYGGVAFGEFGDNVGIYFHIGIVIVVVS